MTQTERDQFDLLFGRYLLSESENRSLREENEALIQLVGVLSPPAVTDDQVRRRRDALLELQGKRVH